MSNTEEKIDKIIQKAERLRNLLYDIQGGFELVEGECFADHLFSRTDHPTAHKSTGVAFGDLYNNSGIVGNVGSTINYFASFDKQEAMLIALYNSLDPLKQAKLLIYADELKKS